MGLLTYCLTETCDIVVVGSGTAGLCCAVRAKQLGANVILLEKTGMIGGASNYVEGIGALNSYMHKEMGEEFDLNEAFLRIQDYHHWGSESSVLHHFRENSGATIDWLHDECGINFFKASQTAPTSYPSWHLVADAEGNVNRELEGFFQPMIAYAESIELDMRLSSPATGLIVDGDTVKGVYYEADGKENAIEADAVVLATGGWADNEEMCNEFAHVDWNRITNWAPGGRDGDGIKWARELGADLHFPGNIMYGSSAIPGQTEFEDPAGWIFTWNYGLRVNENFQVVKGGGEPIPGLFAIGGDNSTYCGAGYDVGIMAGSQQGWCATGGRLVAEYLFGGK